MDTSRESMPLEECLPYSGSRRRALFATFKYKADCGIKGRPELLGLQNCGRNVDGRKVDHKSSLWFQASDK